MLPCVLSATLASTIVTPVNAQQNETYNPVRDLQFTSEMNTDESYISTASEESVELKSDVKYNEDKSSATMTITAPEGYVLSLSDDWKASYKTFLDDGTIVLQNENTNTVSITTNIKAIYRLEVNVKDKDNTLTTQNIDFQTLDIVNVQSDEQQEEETNVADSPAGEVNSRTVNSSVQTSHDSKSLGVSYTGTDSYVWSIPSEINLNNQDTLTVSATKANEEANASLKIVVSSENGFNMKSDTGRTGAYKITKDGNQITNNSTILETTSSGTSTADLKFTANPANFMTAEKYNDTLTFKAQNGYAIGTVLEIEGMKFIVMGQTDDDTYLVIDGESIGNMQYQPNVDSDGNYKVGIFETPNVKRADGQYSNTYEGSYIDNYLENTWYKQLPEKLQKLILTTNIKQVSYDNLQGSKWKYFDPNGGSSNEWYYNEGTTENPNWVIYTKANIPDDAQGAFPLNRWRYSEKGYNNTTYNTISRHVFLPSVEEVSNLVDLNNANKVYNFLKGTNNALYHMWFRDSNFSSSHSAVLLDYSSHSMHEINVTCTWFGVRPAFAIDLSKVSATVVDTVKYK